MYSQSKPFSPNQHYLWKAVIPKRCLIILTIKTVAEVRNVGDTAYAMSHLSAEACTQGYPIAAATAGDADRPSPSTALAVVQPAECDG